MSANSENLNNDLAQKSYELEVVKAQNTFRLETAKVLLDEWKWRHSHCWKTLNRGVLSAVTVSLAPYVWLLKDGDNALKSGLQFWVLIFPVLAALIVWAAINIYAGEYIRCRPVLAKYNELLGENSPNPPDKKATEWKMSIAQWTIFGYGVGATLVSFGNAYLLTRIAHLDITSIDNARAFWISSLLCTVALIYYYLQLMGKTRKGVRARIDAGHEDVGMESPAKAEQSAAPPLPAAAVNEIKREGASKTDGQPVRPNR
jgi:hypothetical protein